MDRLPCELLHHILWYIDQPLDLFRMSYVCSRWRSIIMNDKYFLNQWFSQSLKHSRRLFSVASAPYNSEYKQQSMLNTDHSLFPINLRSCECSFLPWNIPRHSSDHEHVFMHGYPSSLLNSSHSFSFWLFLPRQCKLKIQMKNFKINGPTILLCGNEKYHFDNGKYVSIGNRWIHIVWSKIASQSNYRVWIDGHYVSKLSRGHKSFSGINESLFLIDFVLLRKFDNNSFEASSGARLADLNAFQRCLTLVEIRAFHQQQTSMQHVKVVTYINNNNIDNMEDNNHRKSNYSSFKFILFLVSHISNIADPLFSLIYLVKNKQTIVS